MTVRDDGWPSLSSTTRVVIAVADINDHGPEFEQKFYTVQIPASPSTDKPLFQVSHHFPNNHRSIFVIPSLSSWELGAGIAPFSSSSRWNVAGKTDGIFRSVRVSLLSRFVSLFVSFVHRVEVKIPTLHPPQVSCCIYCPWKKREKECLPNCIKNVRILKGSCAWVEKYRGRKRFDPWKIEILKI